jgi:prepilin signal peptidase PulO-like enzyme (type II secretory pathway)
MSTPSLGAAHASRGSAGAARTSGTASPSSRALLTLALAVLAFAVLPFDRALVAAVTSAALVALAATDIERGIIPNRIVFPAAGLVAALNVVLFPDRALEWMLAGVLAAVVLAIPSLIGRNWVGMGDAKLALLLGAALGWGVVGAVALALVCTLPFSMLLIARGGLAARHATFPFGPFLALGALLVMFGPTLAGVS